MTQINVTDLVRPDSTAVDMIGFNRNNGLLFVQQSGRVYEYGTKTEVFNALVNADSVGRKLNELRNVRGPEKPLNFFQHVQARDVTWEHVAERAAEPVANDWNAEESEEEPKSSSAHDNDVLYVTDNGDYQTALIVGSGPLFGDKEKAVDGSIAANNVTVGSTGRLVGGSSGPHLHLNLPQNGIRISGIMGGHTVDLKIEGL